MNSALTEFLRIIQDPNSESVARVARARGRARAGICVSRFSDFSSRWRTHEPLVSSRGCMSPDLGTGSRIPDPAMKLVGIPGVSHTRVRVIVQQMWSACTVLLSLSSCSSSRPAGAWSD